VGEKYLVALGLEGSLYSWLFQSDGDLEPAEDLPSGSYIQVGAEGGIACALKTNGSLICWDFHIYFDLSYGETLSPSIYKFPGSYSSFEMMGYDTICGQGNNGEQLCVGGTNTYYPPAGSL
jgi:hypothetical protein